MDTVTIRTPQATPLAALYAKHYLSQMGGSAGAGADYPVFRGASYLQRGGGLGDILRSIGRFLMPIAANVASAFVTNTASGLGQGKGIKDAARASLGPSLKVAAQDIGSRMASKLSGGGRRRRRSKLRHPRVAGSARTRGYKKRTNRTTNNLFGSGRKRRRIGKKRRSGGKGRKRARVLLTPGLNF